MSKYVESLGLRPPQVFPIRRSLIPGYFTIDTTVLRLNVLEQKQSAVPGSLRDEEVKMGIWKDVLEIGKRPFHPQRQKRLKFTGMILTDGVGVSIIKSTHVRYVDIKT